MSAASVTAAWCALPWDERANMLWEDPTTGGLIVQRVRELERIAKAAKAFRDWDAVGALLSGDQPHAEDAQNDLRELDAALLGAPQIGVEPAAAIGDGAGGTTTTAAPAAERIPAWRRRQ